MECCIFYGYTVGYIDHNLITNESVTYRAKLHLIVFFKPLLISLSLAVVGGFLFYAQQPWPVAAGLMVLAAIPLFVASVARSSAEFAVTNKRVILKVGFIQKKTAEMFLNKIESV